ncbi:hypothetical protein [Rhodococcus qingshengii]|uniref:hypothetical protein n=1 Tax=Rhodococcus qingshengii TaxID=334542 RepID=UPI001BEBD6EE|nr:hypothetical protein [Rhodococcus qingshengii]
MTLNSIPALALGDHVFSEDDPSDRSAAMTELFVARIEGRRRRFSAIPTMMGQLIRYPRGAPGHHANRASVMTQPTEISWQGTLLDSEV